MDEPPSTRDLPGYADWGVLYAADVDEPVGDAMPGGDMDEMIAWVVNRDTPVALRNADGTPHAHALELARNARRYGAVEAQRLALQEAVLATPAGRAERFWQVGRDVAAGRILRRLVRERLGEELEEMGLNRWHRDRDATMTQR